MGRSEGRHRASFPTPRNAGAYIFKCLCLLYQSSYLNQTWKSLIISKTIFKYIFTFNSTRLHNFVIKQCTYYFKDAIYVCSRCLGTWNCTLMSTTIAPVSTRAMLAEWANPTVGRRRSPGQGVRSSRPRTSMAHLTAAPNSLGWNSTKGWKSFSKAIRSNSSR